MASFDGWIAPVEVGLLLVESVIVKLLCAQAPIPQAGPPNSETQLLGGTMPSCSFFF